jgi:hypothetical protein
MPTHHEHTRRAFAGVEWLGGVGNVCALCAFAVGLWLHVSQLDGTARGAVPLAPLLLLLHPHTPPLRALNPTNR